MSDPVLLALIAGIATTVTSTIASLSTVVISIRNSRKSDTIIGKAIEIHTLTNSTLSEATSALKVANEKIVGLEKLIAAKAESKKEAESVAAKKAGDFSK